MAKLVLIQKNNLILFAHHLEAPWKFWKKRLQLTTQRQGAMDADVWDIIPIAEKDYPDASALPLRDGVLGNGYDFNRYQYWVVASGNGRNKRLRYYDYDTDRYSKKNHGSVFKPHFCKDINKAEFMKSRTYADEVAARCRQDGNAFVTVKEVYVYQVNELLEKNIVVVLRDKEDKRKRARFIREYDFNATTEYKIPMTDKFVNAKRFSFDEFRALYDDIHAKHKNYGVLPKICKYGEEPLAKDVNGAESIEITLKL